MADYRTIVQIQWKKIEYNYPGELEYFKNWLDSWISSYMSDFEYFNVATFFDMALPIQLGVFWKFLSYEGCDLTINVLDEQECCNEVFEYFAASHQQSLSEKSEYKVS